MQNNKLISNLASVGRRFLGTPERRFAKYRAKSFYYSPNGDREVRRRLRQEIRGLAKRAIEVFPSGTYMSVWDQLQTDPAYMFKFRNASVDQLLDIRNDLRADLNLV